MVVGYRGKEQFWRDVEDLRKEIPKVVAHLEESAARDCDEAAMLHWCLKYQLWILPDKWIRWLWRRIHK